MKFNVNIYKSTGVRRVLKVFEFSEGAVVQIPDDSLILFVDTVDADSIEVWAAVPETSFGGYTQDYNQLEKQEVADEREIFDDIAVVPDEEWDGDDDEDFIEEEWDDDDDEDWN